MTINGLKKALKEVDKPPIRPNTIPSKVPANTESNNLPIVPPIAMYMSLSANNVKNKGTTTCGPGKRVVLAITDIMYHNKKTPAIPRLVIIIIR